MSQTPPPLPPGNQAQPPPIPRNYQTIPGTEGMTLEQIEQEVREGGRFVFYTFVISVIILTFKQSSSVRFLKRGKDGSGAAFGYSLLSFLVGWWGIPWGPIYTVGALIRNASGGKDVTAEVMAALVGPARATESMSDRRKPASAGLGMILFRAALIAAPIAIFFSIVTATTGNSAENDQRKNQPGYTAYKAANDSISRDVSGGNHAQATELAKNVAATMKQQLERHAIPSKDGKLPSLDCSVWCNCNADSCVLIMKMSDLGQFNQDSQTMIAEALWSLGQQQLKEHNLGMPGMALATGLRGRVIYDSVMVGRYHPDGLNEPDETLKHSSGVTRLISLFEDRDATAITP